MQHPSLRIHDQKKAHHSAIDLFQKKAKNDRLSRAEGFGMFKIEITRKNETRATEETFKSNQGNSDCEGAEREGLHRPSGSSVPCVPELGEEDTPGSRVGNPLRRSYG